MRFLLCFFFALALRAAEPPLNYLVVLADDLGAADLGCMGSKFYETPHLDRLAADGMKFTAAYAACTVCSPTRAALLTGQYPARLHVTDWIAGHARPKAKLRVPDWKKELDPATTTLAEVLREKGYATAHFGKWHLERRATDHGFDVSVGDNGKGQPATYLSPYKNPDLPDGPPGEELSDRLTQEALSFIEKKKAQPWLVYLSHYAVHTPLGGKPEVIAKYQAKAQAEAPQRSAAYAAMVQAVDDSMGALRAKLDALGLSERTVVIFTSDNGGLLGGPKNPVTANLGLRAGKGSPYEGGVRVAAICRWPGETKPGTTCAVPVITMDWTASIAAAAGVALDADGVDLRPLLRAEEIKPRPLFWHYPHYHPGGATPYSAIRQGNLKLLQFFEDQRLELYDLAADPEEKTDLAASQREAALALATQLDAWRTQVSAQLPLPNPDYDPAAK
jgi:arylsulfatase A-like enzyme